MAKFRRTRYGGDRVVCTNTPIMIGGGFNLDPNITIMQGQTIPKGILASFDELKRVVKIQKTARVKAISAVDAKIVTLECDRFLEPIFVVGEKVLKTVSGTYEAAPSIVKIEHKSGELYIVTLSDAIAGLAVADTIVHVIANTSNDAALVVPKPYALIIEESEESDGADDDEIGVDVTINSGNGSFFLRRIPPIPTAMLGEGNICLKYNSNITFTNSK